MGLIVGVPVPQQDREAKPNKARKPAAKRPAKGNEKTGEKR